LAPPPHPGAPTRSRSFSNGLIRMRSQPVGRPDLGTPPPPATPQYTPAKSARLDAIFCGKYHRARRPQNGVGLSKYHLKQHFYPFSFVALGDQKEICSRIQLSGPRALSVATPYRSFRPPSREPQYALVRDRNRRPLGMSCRSPRTMPSQAQKKIQKSGCPRSVTKILAGLLDFCTFRVWSGANLFPAAAPAHPSRNG